MSERVKQDIWPVRKTKEGLNWFSRVTLPINVVGLPTAMVLGQPGYAAMFGFGLVGDIAVLQATKKSESEKALSVATSQDRGRFRWLRNMLPFGRLARLPQATRA